MSLGRQRGWQSRSARLAAVAGVVANAQKKEELQDKAREALCSCHAAEAMVREDEFETV